MVIFTKRTYDNKKGSLYIPAIWREEFKFYSGVVLGIDCYQDSFVVIDKILNRECTQMVTNSGFLTIPPEIRQRLAYHKLQVLIEQKDERFILAP